MMATSSDLLALCESSFRQQSVGDIVGELLSELLTSVSSEEEGLPVPRVPTGGIVCPASAVDVCKIVRERTPQDVLCGYSERKTGCELLQVRCVDQKASGYCGHYSFYFTLLCLQFSTCGSCEVGLALLHKMKSSVGFWRRYWKSIGLLLKHVQAHPEVLWWPWTEYHVLQGEMERSYLSFLLTCDPYIAVLGGSERISVIQFAYGCIQNSTKDVMSLQQTIEELRASHFSHGHVFILGVTDHWVTVYAYRSAVQHTWDNHGRLSLVYMDSNNVAVLGASDGQIDDIVTEKEKRRVERKGKGYTSWRRSVIRQALCDQRDLVSLLASCLNGQISLPQHILCQNWTSVLESFDQNVTRAVVEPHLFLPLLLQWLETHHRPHTLRDHQVCMLKDFGAGYLSDALQKRLGGWLHYCSGRLSYYQGGIDLVDVFMSVLEQLESFLGERI